MTERLAYLGPTGTFTEEAALGFLDYRGAELVPMSSVLEIVGAVARAEIDHGVVPIENSIEGSVNATLDALVFGTREVLIQGEAVLPIRHTLLARAGVRLDDITAVLSHPHATAQCRTFLARTLPAAEIHAANSTAEAAREVSGRTEPWAAIGTLLAAELYGLDVLMPEIEDHPENSSRFVVLGRSLQEPTGSDKTSVVCFIEKDRPGSLLAILHEFSDRDINLVKLESRPTKQRLGEYCFFIDMEGHAAVPPVSQALESLRTKIMEVRVLGSYPRAPDA